MKKYSNQEIKEFVSKPLFDEEVILNKDTSWPKISIVTPSYNQGQFLERTILSVLNQNYPNLEYIIIDGGSTDESVEIIKKYEKYLAYWISESDRGISEGFNKGIKKAKGEIIGILNSDDWYEKDTIETIVKMDKKYNAEIYIGALRCWDEKGNTFVIRPDFNFFKKIDYCMPNLNHPTVFIKRKVYEKVKLFNENLKYVMDYDFLLRAIKEGKRVQMTIKVLANMREGGVSFTKAVEAYREVAKIAPNKIKAYLWCEYSIIKFYIRKLLKKLRLYLVLRFFRKIKYD